MGLFPQFMGMVLELLKNAKRDFSNFCALKLINNFIKVDDICSNDESASWLLQKKNCYDPIKPILN